MYEYFIKSSAAPIIRQQPHSYLNDNLTEDEKRVKVISLAVRRMADTVRLYIYTNFVKVL
jgi:hypothetical protein